MIPSARVASLPARDTRRFHRDARQVGLASRYAHHSWLATWLAEPWQICVIPSARAALPARGHALARAHHYLLGGDMLVISLGAAA